MAEQVAGDDSLVDTLFGFAKSGFETASGYVQDAASVLYEGWRNEKLTGDNASANPDTAPVVTKGVQATGEPVTFLDGVSQNWAMYLALLIVVVALVAFVWRLVS